MIQLEAYSRRAPSEGGRTRVVSDFRNPVVREVLKGDKSSDYAGGAGASCVTS